MTKFLTGNNLNTEVEKIFEEAKNFIVVISPYIKLHPRFESTLKSKIDSPTIKVVVLFGKNEDNFSKSLKQEDFSFFKRFPNIEIRYEKRLHAKYYANESSAIITSMNLYSFSQDNNIEAGVLTSVSVIEDLKSRIIDDSLDRQAWNYFERVIEQSELLFKKTPDFESTMMGLSKKYKGSRVETDKLSSFFTPNTLNNTGISSPKSIEVQRITIDRATQSTKLISATALAKKIGTSNKELLSKLENHNLVERVDNKWILTTNGRNRGAEVKTGHYGEYIAWPENIIDDIGF